MWSLPKNSKGGELLGKFKLFPFLSKQKNSTSQTLIPLRPTEFPEEQAEGQGPRKMPASHYPNAKCLHLWLVQRVPTHYWGWSDWVILKTTVGRPIGKTSDWTPVCNPVLGLDCLGVETRGLPAKVVERKNACVDRTRPGGQCSSLVIASARSQQTDS